jgi:glycosyltransferase involved in cell wall biosynthesis
MDNATHQALTQVRYRFDWPPIIIFHRPQWMNWLGFGQRQLRWVRRVLRIDRLQEMSAFRYRGYWTDLLRINNIDLVHVFVHSGLLNEMPVPHIFEVTSPDIADRIIRTPALISPWTLLHSVSPSVGERLDGRFLINRKIVAPLPFFDPPKLAELSPKKRNLVVFAHRMIPRKNPVIFARAAKRFVAERPDWQVFIRGTGPLQPEVRRILAAEIAAGLIDVGYTSNLLDELGNSRIFVSLIEQDNYPSQSILEAMWSHNALLLSNRGDTRSRFFANNGILCEINVEEVAGSLIKLAADPQRLSRYGENSRSHVERNFNAELYLAHLLDIYRSTIEEVQIHHTSP